MKSSTKRKLSLILLSAIIVSSIASCGSDKSKTVNDDSTSGAINSASDQTSSNEPDFPDVDYGGEEILFMTQSDGNGNGPYVSREIFAASENGELINDAVYKRNLKVEERFNVRIAENCVNDTAAQARTAIMAGEDVYDVVSRHECFDR